MRKILIVKIDEEKLRTVCNDNELTIDEMIKKEMNWVAQSGILITKIEDVAHKYSCKKTYRIKNLKKSNKLDN